MGNVGLMKAPPRKKIRESVKTAAALLKIKIGAEGGRWLIPEELRGADAVTICRSVQWDHIRRHAEDGDDSPQNLDPMLIADHHAKTHGKKGDIAEVAKGKRFGKKEAEFRRRLLAKNGLAETPPPAKRKSRPIQSAGFQKDQRPLNGRNPWKK
jgi:hypothetical protein